MRREPLHLPAPVIQTDEDLDNALRSLQLLNAREAADKAELEQRTAAIALEIQASQLVRYGRNKERTLKEYRDELLEQATAYAEAHRDELLPDGKKTRRFTHGEVSFRKQAARLVDVDGNPETTEARLLLCTKAFGVKGLLVALLKALAGFRVNKHATAEDLFKITLKPDRKRILDLAQKEKLEPDWLEANNLKIEEGGETVSLKPDAAVLQTETRRAA